jgi:hypothetical protein
VRLFLSTPILVECEGKKTPAGSLPPALYGQGRRLGVGPILSLRSVLPPNTVLVAAGCCRRSPLPSILRIDHRHGFYCRASPPPCLYPGFDAEGVKTVTAEHAESLASPENLPAAGLRLRRKALAWAANDPVCQTAGCRRGWEGSGALRASLHQVFLYAVR